MSAQLSNRECQWLSDTYIEAEELAYNTYSGGHSRSNRHGMVRYPDGTIRACTLGVPNSYFTIPAHGYLPGHRYVSGFVSVDTDYRNGEGQYIFTITSR